jgi:hypothetical protein
MMRFIANRLTGGDYDRMLNDVLTRMRTNPELAARLEAMTPKQQEDFVNEVMTRLRKEYEARGIYKNGRFMQSSLTPKRARTRSGPNGDVGKFAEVPNFST